MFRIFPFLVHDPSPGGSESGRNREGHRAVDVEINNMPFMDAQGPRGARNARRGVLIWPALLLALLLPLLAPAPLWADNLAADQHIAEGRRLLAEKKYLEAQAEFNAALKEAPRYDRAHAAIGFFYLEFENIDKAINEFELAAAHNSRNPEYPFMLGTLRQRKGSTQKALIDFQTAVRLDPKFHKAYYEMGMIYVQEGKLDQAAENLQQALSRNPAVEDEAVYRLALGKVKLKQGDEKLAIEQFEKVKSSTKADSEQYRDANQAIEDIGSQRKSRTIRKAGTVVLILLLVGVVAFVGYRFLLKKTAGPAAITEIHQEKKETSDLDGVAQYCLRKILSLTELSKGLVLLSNREMTQLTPNASAGMEQDIVGPLEIHPMELTAWLDGQGGKPFLFNVEKKEALFNNAFPDARSILDNWEMRVGVPLTHKDRLVGMGFAGCRKTRDAARLRKVFENNLEILHHLAMEVAESVENLTLYDLSIRDELTGAFNKRYFGDTISQTLQKMRELRHPATLIMIDIDHFKQLNDSYGHPQGDVVLRDIVAGLTRCIREGVDVLARVGGEEFAVLIPSGSIEAGMKFAEKMRTTIASMTLPAPLPRVTISLGVAGFPKHGRTAEELIQAADEALYASKRDGRNRVSQAEIKASKEEETPYLGEQPVPEEAGAGSGTAEPPVARKPWELAEAGATPRPGAKEPSRADIKPEEIKPEAKELEFPPPSWQPVTSGEPVAPSSTWPGAGQVPAPMPAPAPAPAAAWAGQVQPPVSAPAPAAAWAGPGQPPVSTPAPAAAMAGSAAPPSPGLGGAPPMAPWASRTTAQPATDASGMPFKPGRGLLRRSPPTPASPWGGAGAPPPYGGAPAEAQAGWSVQPPPMAAPWGAPAQAAWGGTPAGGAFAPGAPPAAALQTGEADAMKSAGLEPVSSEPATDPVSHFYTQSYFHYKLIQEMTQAYHQQKPCSVAFFAIDHLDVVENRRGKAKGEELIREIADTVNDFLREGSDLPGHYSEHSFSLILPRTSSKIALNLAEQIRQTIESMGMGEPEEPVRLSFGIASYPEQATSPGDLVQYGRKAMEQAQEAGGNQTVIYHP